jgi:hypothetical protein
VGAHRGLRREIGDEMSPLWASAALGCADYRCGERRHAGIASRRTWIAGRTIGKVQLHELIRRYIADVVAQEWRMMAQGTANLRAIPGVLAEALQATLALNPSSEGQKTAQRDIATALETALDARRQRIIISESQVNLLKWACLFMQAVCALVAIAMVHSDNRLASIIAMGIFATGVAASILLILAHDRPFTGEISIKPDPLLQVMPEAARR